MHENRKEKRNRQRLPVLLAHDAAVGHRGRLDRQHQFSWHASPNISAIEAGHSPDYPIYGARTLGAHESRLLPSAPNQRICPWIGVCSSNRCLDHGLSALTVLSRPRSGLQSPSLGRNRNGMRQNIGRPQPSCGSRNRRNGTGFPPHCRQSPRCHSALGIVNRRHREG